MTWEEAIDACGWSEQPQLQLLMRFVQEEKLSDLLDAFGARIADDELSAPEDPALDIIDRKDGSTPRERAQHPRAKWRSWQVRIMPAVGGPVVTGARRRGRGPWLPVSTIPDALMQHVTAARVNNPNIARLPENSIDAVRRRLSAPPLCAHVLRFGRGITANVTVKEG